MDGRRRERKGRSDQRSRGPEGENVYDEASALNYDLNTAISALSRAMFFFSVDVRRFPLIEALVVALLRCAPVGFSQEILFN